MYNKNMRVLLLFILFISFSVAAEPEEKEEAEKKERAIPLLDSAQDLFGNKINALANRLDSFFANERADDELGRSLIRVQSRYEIRERASGDLNNRYRFNLRLPSLEEKFKLMYKNEKDKNKEITEKEAEKTKKRNKVRTGWLFNADAGLVVSIPPRITTRARLRKSFETGTVIHRFVEEVTYVTDESGLEEETSLTTDHTINDKLLFRFINSKRWRVLQKNFTTAHGPSVLHQLSEDDAFNYSFIMSSVVNDGIWFVNNYRLAINYRRNLYKNWLYMDLIPGIDFPKTWSFRRTPFAILQIEAIFGD